MPEALFGLAMRQRDIVSRKQALQAGMTAGMIKYRVRSGRWRQVHPGVYATFSGELDRRSRIWAALLYAGVGTWLTIKIGRPLVPLNFDQQRLEANFRFSLVRLRENAESVALYRGEAMELGVFQERFRHVFENFWQIMKRQKRLSWFTSGYAQIAVIFPVVVVAPRYFAKQISLGGLMQVVGAFSAVQNSLSFIISSYTSIAAWQAVTISPSRTLLFSSSEWIFAALIRCTQ